MEFDGKKFAMALGEKLMNKGIGSGGDKKPGTDFASYLKNRKKKNQFGVEELDKGIDSEKTGDMPSQKPEAPKSLMNEEEDSLSKKYKYIG